MTAITPIVVAWLGYVATKNEKQTKKYIEAQEELKKANAIIKSKELEEMQKHFEKLDKSICQLAKQVNILEESIDKVSEIDRRIDGLITMSNVDFEFCNSLSSIITSIGNALDSSDVIDSGTLQQDLINHRKKTEELVNKAVKIVF